MGLKGISEKTRKIYQWLDSNESLVHENNAALYSVFPEIKPENLVFHKSQWKKKRATGEWPEDESKNETIDTSIASGSRDESTDSVQAEFKKSESIDTSNNTSTKQNETSQDSAKSIDESISKNESINAFIYELFDRKKTLMKILDVYQEVGLIPQGDIKLEKPFKTVSFNLMEKTVSDFSAVCKKLGISQRKAIHKAMVDFIHNSKQKENDET